MNLFFLRWTRKFKRGWVRLGLGIVTLLTLGKVLLGRCSAPQDSGAVPFIQVDARPWGKIAFCSDFPPTSFLVFFLRILWSHRPGHPTKERHPYFGFLPTLPAPFYFFQYPPPPSERGPSFSAAPPCPPGCSRHPDFLTTYTGPLTTAFSPPRLRPFFSFILGVGTQ